MPMFIKLIKVCEIHFVFDHMKIGLERDMKFQGSASLLFYHTINVNYEDFCGLNACKWEYSQ